MERANDWNSRLTAVAIGLIIALTALTVRHWGGTYNYGHPPCYDCRSDFPCFYAGAKLIWHSPAALYDEASQLAIQRTIDPRIGDAILPFTHPPFTALIYMPLGWLPFSAAYLAITVLNLLLLAISFRLLAVTLKLTRRQSAWLILSGLCNFGVHSAVLQGQTSLIILALLAVFTAAMQKRRNIGAGVSAGLIFVKPQLLVVPFLILLSRRRWLALMIGSFVVAVLVFFSVIVVGWPAIMDYIKLLTSYLTKEHGHGSYPESMQNLRAVAQYLVSYSWARTLWLGLISLVLAAVLLLNASSGSNAESAAIQWIGNFVSGILIAPHFNAHDLTIVIVPVAFALKIFGDPVPAWLISSIVALGVYPLIALATGNILPPIVPVVLLAVLFFCVRRVRMVVNATDQPDKAMVST